MKNIFVLCMLFCVGLAVAQGPRSQPLEAEKFGYWSGAEIKASVMQVKPGERPEFARLNRGDHNFSLSYRDKDGSPEMHAEWTDIYIVQSGEATLVHGGKLEGATERRPGEFGGGTIINGERQKLVAGDIASSPAGMPHQFLVADGTKFAYITIKVAKHDMP